MLIIRAEIQIDVRMVCVIVHRGFCYGYIFEQVRGVGDLSDGMEEAGRAVNRLEMRFVAF